MILYNLQRQRTAGAYQTIKTYVSYAEAEEALIKIASQTPHIPYTGKGVYKDSNNIHNVNRYRITETQIN